MAGTTMLQLLHRLPPSESIPLRHLSQRWAETTITRQKGRESTRARLSMSKQVQGNMIPADLRVRARLVQVAGIVATQTSLCLTTLPGAENQPEILHRVLPPPRSCRRPGSGTSPLPSTCASSAQQALTGLPQTLREADACSQVTGASMKGTSSSTRAVARVTTCEACVPCAPNCVKRSQVVLAV